MTNQPNDEPIRSAFAHLRAAERPQVAPPGADAAHRTVRHRRRRTAATAGAGLAAVVLLGAGYLAGTGLDPAPEPLNVADGSPTDAPASSQSPEEPDPATADLEPDDGRDLSEVLGEALGSEGKMVLWTDPGYAAGEPKDAVMLGSPDGVRPPGTYLVQVACAGESESGSVQVVVAVGGNEAEVTAECGATVEDARAGVGEAELVIGDDNTELAIALDRAPDGAEGLPALDEMAQMIGLTLIPQ